jgi:hypothetical protein
MPADMLRITLFDTGLPVKTLPVATTGPGGAGRRHEQYPRSVTDGR